MSSANTLILWAAITIFLNSFAVVPAVVPGLKSPLRLLAGAVVHDLRAAAVIYDVG